MGISEKATMNQRKERLLLLPRYSVRQRRHVNDGVVTPKLLKAAHSLTNCAPTQTYITMYADILALCLMGNQMVQRKWIYYDYNIKR